MNLYPENYQTDIARKMAAIINLVFLALRYAYAMTHKEDPRLPPGLIWIMATVRRLDQLTQRFLAGKLRPLRARAHARASAQRPSPQCARRLTGHMWMVKLVPTTSCAREPLQAYLESAEVRALIAAAPQAGRIFRPLCRMLGIDIPAHLQLPERPKRVHPKPDPKPKPASVRQSYPFPGVPRRWQTRIPGINAPRLKNRT